MEGRSIYYLGNGYYHDPQTNHYYRDMRSASNRNAARQRNTQSQNQPKEEGKGFGFLLAAAVGFVAAYFAKNFLSGLIEEETERPKENPREFYRSDSRQSQNTEQQVKPVDPADAELEECTDVVCPITLELMHDPVISKKCGHSFEDEAIRRWLRSRDYCPKCHVNLRESDLVKNYSLKNAIEYMRKQIKKEPKQ